MQLSRGDDVVPLEHAHGSMPGNLHGRGLVNPSIYQIAYGRAAKVVRDEPGILIPLLTRLPAKPHLNTSLVPLLSEVGCVKYSAIRRLRHFLSIPSSSGDKGRARGLRFLMMPAGR